MSILPTFIIPGAAKAGTTTLHFYLDQHPEILMSRVKEPNVFDYKMEKMVDLRRYDAMFIDYSGEKAVGESSVNYMANPESPAAIKQHIPDVKLIFSLRDPIRRAVSHYWHRINDGSATGPLVIHRNAFPIKYGLYNTHIRRFLELFPRKNIYINIIEEMNQNLDESFTRIFHFLGVDDSFRIVKQMNRNPASRKRSLSMFKFLKNIQRNKKYTKHFPKIIREVGRKLTDNLMEWNLEPFRTPPIEPETERKLAEIFIPEIEGLEELLGREITVWTTKQAIQLP